MTSRALLGISGRHVTVMARLSLSSSLMDWSTPKGSIVGAKEMVGLSDG